MAELRCTAAGAFDDTASRALQSQRYPARLFAFGKNGGADSFDVMEDLIVGEAYEAVATTLEVLECVGCRKRVLAAVDFAVDFDNEIVFGAVEIDNVRADGVLPPKFEQPKPLRRNRSQAVVPPLSFVCVNPWPACE
ncbi:MAG: hypothetical protein R2911_37390 [Caldilineaceae bacterium]